MSNDLEIPPAWMIEELEKLRHEKNQRHELFIEIPQHSHKLPTIDDITRQDVPEIIISI